MARPYSNDLRQRVVAAVNEDELGPVEVARLYRVDRKTVTRWVDRADRTGSVAPDPMGGWRHGITDSAGLAVLKELVEDARSAADERNTTTTTVA